MQLYNNDLELTLLSSFIFNNDVPVNVDSDIFYNSVHTSIFLSIKSLHEQNSSIDEVIVKNHLINKLKLDPILVEEYLLKILTTTPVSNLNHYIEILESLRKKRNIQTALLSLNESLLENKSSDELEGLFINYSEKILNKSSVKLFNLTPASLIEAKDSEFITKNFIPVPKRTVSLFTAGGGTGKTSLLLQLAMHYLYENTSQKAFCWLSEDPLGLTKHRLNGVINGLFEEGFKTLDRLILSDDLTFPILLEENRSMTINSLFYKMKILLKDFKLIIFDPLIAFFGGDENNNAHAKLFMQLFTKWAAEEDKTIIFIHHSTKNTSQSRGASAFVDAARAVYEIEKLKDGEGNEIDSNKRTINIVKDNYRASKYFNGFSKDIEVFSKSIDTIKLHTPPLLSNEDELGIN